MSKLKYAILGVILLLVYAAVMNVASRYFSDTPYISGLKRDSSENALLLDVPFLERNPRIGYTSEASTAMVLKYYGYKGLTQDYVYENIGSQFENMYPELGNFLENSSYKSLRIKNLKNEIDENDPVLIQIQTGSLHTLVVVGYSENFIYIHDPDRGPYLGIDAESLTSAWVPSDNGYISIVMD